MTTAMTAIYGGTPLYDPTDTVVNDIINSKYSTYVYWTLHVNSSGDITHNGSPLVTAGKYVGSTTWVTQLVKLKKAGIRVLFSVGSWPYPGPSKVPYTPWIFYYINHFLPTKSVTTGLDTFEVYTIPTSADKNVLYDNFNELREAFKYTDSSGETAYALDGINFDNEDYYSSSLMTTFARMLYAIGYSQVTFCPYNNMNIWMDTLQYVAKGNSAPIKGQTPTYADGSTPSSWTTKGLDTYATGLSGYVTDFQLQCYSGGASDFPADWINAIAGLGLTSVVPVYPGYYVNSDESSTPSCAAGSIICPDGFESVFNDLSNGYNSYGQNPNSGNPPPAPSPVPLNGGFVWNYDQVSYCQNAPNATTGCSETPNAKNYRSAMLKGLGLSTT